MHARLGEQQSDVTRPVLSVIIPVYNEVNTIGEVLERIHSVPVSKEIVVVDDGSTDGTGELVERERNKYNIILITLTSNKGKGTSVRTGLKHVQGEIVVIQDADLELDPAEIPRLIRPIQEGQTEVVFGSRYLGRGVLGRVPGQPFSYWLANKILTLATNLLYGSCITDMGTAYKVCRASVVNGIKLESPGFEIDAELAAKFLRLGYHIHEVPISYRPRTRFEGKKIVWKDGVKLLYRLFKYRFQGMRTFVSEPDLHPR